MHGKAMGKVTLRSLPAWGPTSMQALRVRGFLMFTAAFVVLGTEKALNRELMNEAIKMGTYTLQREHPELLNALA